MDIVFFNCCLLNDFYILDDLLVVSSPLSVTSTWGWVKNRLVNKWIHVQLCGNKVGAKKNVCFFCGLDDEVVRC